LLDVVMEHDAAGLDLVEYIRSELGNRRIRIILRTGQAGFAPEYRVVQNYDINDYLAKSESTQERLFVSLTTALRGYRDVVAADVYARRALEAEQEREVAARALESKTQFLAHLSHEIRNPLTGVVGIVELLESESLSPSQIELVGDLEYTVQSLLGVVDDVLDVAKIEAGRLQLHHEAFNARLWLQRSSAVLAANIRRKGITLTSECAAGVPEYLVGDAARMRQILVNFLSNACKFTPEGGRIHVQLNAESRRDKLILHLSVSDSGVGIDSSKLADVFQPYEQASGLTALEYGGTGLGLSLCQNLAELMKGQVGVISQPNRGSIFWFDVPVDVMSETTETIDTLPSESLNIAICEDDLTNQRTLQVILTKRGMTVETFNNGRELLDSDGWKKMDVILMDCHMPVLNGMDTTRQLRKQGCTIPVIALTAGVSDTERQLCLDSGMDAVMAKPVDFLLLHEQVLAFVRYGRHPVSTTL
jgi:signal transduction histidine kinase